MQFQCGQGELAGNEGVGSFVFQQKEVSTCVREGNVNGELGTEPGSARVWDTIELGEGRKEEWWRGFLQDTEKCCLQRFPLFI